MKIGGFDLYKDIFIVAEIGNNHEGDYNLAEKMIGIARGAGADAVKFQTIVPKRLISSDQKKRLRQLEKFQLTYRQFEKLNKAAVREGVIFLSTPFDVESVHFLAHLVPAFKVASCDNTFFPLIEAIARTDKPVILSTGLANIAQVRRTKSFIESLWRASGFEQELAVLHCVTSYPVKTEEANLLAIKTLRDRLGVTAGYSDHTIGIDAAVLSVALGARIIEKHFTIDKGYSDFRDHRISANPREFKAMVKKIRDAEKLLGSGVKCLQDCEKDAVKALRRSIAAKRSLQKGEVLNLDALTWLRANRGLAAGREEQFLGRVINRDIRKGEAILPKDVS